MDHLRGAVGVYRKEDHVAVQQLFRRVRLPPGVRSNPLHTGVALSPQVQQREQLLNCALFLHTGPIDADDPLRALHDLVRLRRPGGALATVARQPRALGRTVVDRAVLRRGTAPRAVTEITLQCMVEQRPDRESRITLSRRTDAHGVPLPVIDWRTSDQEARTVRFAASRFAAEMRRLGLPEPELPRMIADPEADFRLTEMAHPTGTTRMSADPRCGVVDTHCAVHGVSGLFVAGSSVFPTAGHANPTQMIVALAIRLADHLKDRPAAPVAGHGRAAGNRSLVP
jgi:choline dehydrogenase-like flavoprotein